MRISDWSSDVCSSDLTAELGHAIGAGPMPETAGVIGEAREPLARGEIEFGAVVRDARRIPQSIGLDRADRGKVAVDLARACGACGGRQVGEFCTERGAGSRVDDERGAIGRAQV